MTLNTSARGVHDMGGLQAGPVDRHEHALSFFEQRVDAMMRMLMHPDSGHFTVDGMRRAIESLPSDEYDALSYYERWLCAMHRLVLENGLVAEAELAARVRAVVPHDPGHDHPHAHPHDHPHDHNHEDASGKDPHAPVEETFTPRADLRVLEQALRELLIEKAVFSADQLRRQIEQTDSRAPELGAKVVARAWVDADFKARLLANAKHTISEFLRIDLSGTPDLIVVENTATRHHVICCTLCSCYPRAVLGVPPAWYKSREYRARVVFEPRHVLAEFGTVLAPEVTISVVDSNADMRYIVLPHRPAGTQHLDEAALAALVTRDSMIGVSLPLRP